MKNKVPIKILFVFDFTIGHGVFTTRDFEKGSFLLEYPGELITSEEGEARNEEYKKRKLGSFLYYFPSADGKQKLW